jgi:hypothetical protein
MDLLLVFELQDAYVGNAYRNELPFQLVEENIQLNRQAPIRCYSCRGDTKGRYLYVHETRFTHLLALDAPQFFV